MNKKPGLLFSVVVFTIIMVAASFHLSLSNNAPVKIPANVNPDTVLYVCPADSSTWQSVSESFHMLSQFAPLFFSFVVIVLLFSWGWALYQNLLKDKFSDDVYKNPWGITKVIFWLMIGFAILLSTPNHYRHVDVRGHGADWVLCESTSEGAHATKYKNVSLP